MALLANGFRLASMNPCKTVCSVNHASNTDQAAKGPATERIQYTMGSAGTMHKAASPRGSYGPVARVLPRTAGEIAAKRGNSMALTIPAATLAGGLPGSGSASMSLTVSDASAQLIAAMTGSAAMRMSASGTVAGALFGSGSASMSMNASGSIGAIGNMSGTSHMVMSAAGTIMGIGYMSSGEESSGLTAAGIAAAVWSAISASNNDPGTMGEKVNDAGAAGDPWNTTVPGAYGEGTAGALMGKLLTTSKFLGLK